MPIEMRPHLPLGFSQEPETPVITTFSGKNSNGERPEVPERIQETCPRIQLPNSLRGPLEMLHFLTCGTIKRGSNQGIVANNGLTLIKRLRANFANMIDTHQRTSVPLVAERQTRLWQFCSGRAPHPHLRTEQCSKGLINRDNCRVKRHNKYSSGSGSRQISRTRRPCECVCDSAR